MATHGVLRGLRKAPAFLLIVLTSIGPSFGAEILPPGFRPRPLGVHALTGGKVVIKPGEIVDGATIVIRDGVIKEVGKDITLPADARVWDMKGTVVYAGFIDSYLVAGSTNGPVSTADSEPVDSSALADGGINFYGVAGKKAGREKSGPGYRISKVKADYRAVRDYSPKEKFLTPLRKLGFTAGLIAPGKGIIRGTSALVALSQEDPNEIVIRPDVFQHIGFETHDRDDGDYPGALMGVIAAVRQGFFDAQHYAQMEGASNQTRRVEFDPALEALQPALAKKMRVMFEPGSVLMVDRAARVARELGLEFCLVSSGQEWRRPDLAKGTTTIFIVPLNFPTLPKLPSDDDWDQVSLDQLRAWDWASENPAVLRKQGLDFALTTHGLSDPEKFRHNLRLALDRGLDETNALEALTTVPAKLCGVENQLGTIEAGKRANLTVVEGESYFNPDAKVREVWIDGRIYRAPAETPKHAKKDGEKGTTASADTSDQGKTEPPKDEKSSSKKDTLRELGKVRVARSPLEGRGVIASPPSVLIRNATIWTCGDKGIMTNADVLFAGGKVESIGSIKAAPTPDTVVIDGPDLNVSPGLIDCHSHTAILGAVNESTLPSTAMVRIRDVVNSETDHLYEQLAGGVTAVNLLHGSANPIGGQNCVIKLRDGAGPDELIFTNAPPGIKFALGENVKQSNWGEKYVTRFPQTRMGVRTFIANRFTAAREYLDQSEAASKDQKLAPPARDLELEAIGEILQGKRWIHCHSYRQDEILMLIRLMESFGVKIATFQHVLEGYKVADEIARHGAGGSTFSDWWAYKFEVYDAIPYNGSLMRDRGVIVSFNSDSSELARRLYLEAAKAVKYGATPEAEALKFVTLNPAKQLRIDDRVGSLEPGKDADFVIWSRSPLSSATVCLQTWIDGKKYFDRSLAEGRAAALSEERRALIDKAKKLSKASSKGDEGDNSDEGESFFRTSLEHEFDGVERHCQDEE